MQDPYGRTISYLRVSITDRCNLRCRYCMPASGVPLSPHADILSYEEITEFVRVAVGRGISKVRLTGGEPLVRRGVVGLVESLAVIAGLQDLCMTTNGILLPELAAPLRAAGLQRVNVSLDTLDPDRYRELTRGGDVTRVRCGLEAARAAGLAPIKINCVVEHSRDEPDARAMAAFARDEGFEVRFIREMDIAVGTFHAVDGGRGGDCRACDRLRLTARGGLRPCLFSDIEVPIRGRDLGEVLDEAVRRKPARGTRCTRDRMHAIGG